MSSFFDQVDGLPCDWLTGQGPSGDLVISTRARLARNLAGFHFPHHCKSPELETVFKELAEVLAASSHFAGGPFMTLSELTGTQRQLLQEKHLASPNLLQDLTHRGLMVAPAGALVGLVNEEDHLRVVSYASGFDPSSVVAAVSRVETDLEKSLAFAYQEDLGYLTTSPTSVGTGLRISALVHLPGLVLADEIEKILNALRQLHFSVRGLFGEGTSVRGAIFQISNLITLGRDEEEICDDFSFHVGKVLLHEKSARQQLYARDHLWLEDMAYRSLAILQSARTITSQETYDRLSHVRLGVGLGILDGITFELLNDALIGHQTAHLEFVAGRALPGKAKAEARATFLREMFGR